jgi:hypothetical protein
MSNTHINLNPEINRKGHNGNWKRTFFLEPAVLFLHNSHPSTLLLEVVLSSLYVFMPLIKEAKDKILDFFVF